MLKKQGWEILPKELYNIIEGKNDEILVRFPLFQITIGIQCLCATTQLKALTLGGSWLP